MTADDRDVAPEPAEARALADAFEAATSRVARQVTRALRERAVTITAAGVPDDAPDVPAGPFHVDPDDIMRDEWWSAAVDLFIVDQLTTEIMVEGRATAAELGVAFDLLNPALERTAQAHVDSIRSWGPAKRQWVSAEIRQGMVEGLSVRNMAARLVDDPSSPLNGLSARRTAQTELIAAQNGANHVTYAQSGLQGVKRWMSTPDFRTRPSHVAMAGVGVPMGVPFTVGGYTGDYPGSPDLPAKERVNCRCRMVFEPSDKPVDPSTVIAPVVASAAAFITENPDGSVTYGGAMVAARVPGWYAVAGGLQPAEMHITLQYLGNESIYDRASRELIVGRVERHLDGVGPFDVTINGWGVLGGEYATVMLCEAGQLNDLHDCLSVDVHGPPSAREHPGFIPHFTLGYRLDPVGLDLNGLIGESFTVTEVLVAFGCTVTPDGDVLYGEGSETIPLEPPDDEPRDPDLVSVEASSTRVRYDH